MELVEFLRARLDADEAAWRGGLDLQTRPDFARLSKQMLDDVEAKRRIVALHDSDGAHECAGGGDGWGDATVWEHSCPTLRLMAFPYADHPDFDERWRP